MGALTTKAWGGSLSLSFGFKHRLLGPKQAMFKTEAEAQAAAPGFGCEGAHRMGEMWMVCANHTDANSHHGH